MKVITRLDRRRRHSDERALVLAQFDGSPPRSSSSHVGAARKRAAVQGSRFRGGVAEGHGQLEALSIAE